MRLRHEEEFLNQVLQIPTVNGRDDEGKLARFLAKYLKDCGVNAAVREIDKKHANIVAVIEGKTKEKVIWNGHLDTVPYGKLSEWNTQPDQPEKRHGCIYARGASDMKSGLAAMVYVLGEMKRRSHIPRQTIYFIGTCDEEKGGLGAEQVLKEHLMDDAALLLIGEPTEGRIGTAQKGCVWLRAIVHGETSHGAYPQQGINAIEYGICFFEALKKKISEFEHMLLGKPTIQITEFSGGIAPNMTPDEAEICMDIRIIPEISANDILKWAEEIRKTMIEKAGKRLAIELRLENLRKAIETDPGNKWVRRVERVLRYETGEIVHTGIHFFTDASILTRDREDLPVIILGPGKDELAHKANEYVEIEKYLQYIRILRRLF